MSFRIGFLTGLSGMALAILLIPNVGPLTLELSLMLTTKFVREPLQINRYDYCPDAVDFKIRP
jgi:hypothetical protein